MAIYTQANRPMRVDTVLGSDVLLLEGFQGTESVSEPFAFRLDLLSETEDLDPLEVLRKPMQITLQLHNGGPRVIHGLVRRFAQLGQERHLTHYRAELVPWLSFLALSRDSRIYQRLTVPEIIEQVFRALGYSDFEFRTQQSYPKREYCVQYRETHLDFVSRLMEEEGLFYFFEHTPDRHLLVVGDSNIVFDPCPGQSRLRFHPQAPPDDNVVRSFEQEMAAWVGRVTLRAYDFTHPALDLESSTAGSGVEEVYDYPGKYVTLSDGDRLARLRLEAEEVTRRLLRGGGSARALVSGARFELDEHYRTSMNAEYILLRVQHRAAMGGYRGQDSNSELDYQNEFLALPADTTYRTARRTPRPLIHGTQTALVVGPAGEEIHTDKYGRVKVQFYWDRVGHRNEDSSCWVRVGTPWAGKGYGNITIPRIGNEVIVQFLEGDPDQPLIMGAVFNADQAVPFDLPGSGIQQGIKSRSSPGGGGNNEISVTDTKGSELMNIHAAFDQTESVGHDQSSTVGNNRSSTVAVNDSETIGSKQTIAVGSDQGISVGGNQHVTVGGDRAVSVAGNDSLAVGAARQVASGGDMSLHAGGDFSASAAGKVSTSSGAATNLTVGAAFKATVAATADISAGGAVTISGSKITLSAGGSSIEIGPAGVTLTTGGPITLKGAIIKDNC